jgi:SAM-dependent methyltransferase
MDTVPSPEFFYQPIAGGSEMIEHPSRPPRAIREAVRVLRPGDVLAITTPSWGGQGVVRLASLTINQAVLAGKAGRNQALTTGPRACRVC